LSLRQRPGAKLGWRRRLSAELKTPVSTIRLTRFGDGAIVATDVGDLFSPSGTKCCTTLKGRTVAITASAVLIGIDDYRALEETAYLLRAPANVRWLVESLEQARAGEVQQHELDR